MGSSTTPQKNPCRSDEKQDGNENITSRTRRKILLAAKPPGGMLDFARAGKMESLYPPF
jgi:hypothetical protein